MKTKHYPVTINLKSPEGSALCLISYASQFSNELGYNNDEKETILLDMMRYDYKHLVSVFERHFSTFVTLIK